MFFVKYVCQVSIDEWYIARNVEDDGFVVMPPIKKTPPRIKWGYKRDKDAVIGAKSVMRLRSVVWSQIYSKHEEACY